MGAALAGTFRFALPSIRCGALRILLLGGKWPGEFSECLEKCFFFFNFSIFQFLENSCTTRSTEEKEEEEIGLTVPPPLLYKHGLQWVKEKEREREREGPGFL